jgi:hypothetical protein
MMGTHVLQPEGVSANGSSALRGLFAKISTAISGTVGAVAGTAPHVLHHVGPLAGAAVFTGIGRTALFGVIGFALTMPMLFRLRRRFGTWLAPGMALAFFITMFTASAIWIGPAIGGDSGSDGQPTDHTSHHS